ncbi:hypothetical protein MIND_01142800 [Mycena indigotica]|uniref:Uncharacterized protein n=1 Tax=Mycena indigotica TaxID=2126181 RepID=A0A8H6VZB3_9AGAR|nr:uncharacterized protein MIND_01142800 [Mycena indigotica]KAF7293634.1 hypothetical protein MIND_01142800 [Mycena indigotica]
MAAITMAIVILDKIDTGDWRSAVQRAANASFQWLDDLQDSVVGDMRIRRLGGMIDLTKSKSHQEHHLPRHIHWLLPFILGRLPVPLYFYYGYQFPVTEPIPPALIEKGLVPDLLEVEHLQMQSEEVVFSLWDINTPVWASLRNAPEGFEPTPPPRPPPKAPRPNLFQRPPKPSRVRSTSAERQAPPDHPSSWMDWEDREAYGSPFRCDVCSQNKARVLDIAAFEVLAM